MLTKKQQELCTKQSLKKMKKEGLTIDQISKKVKLPRPALYYYIKKYGLYTPRKNA